MELKKKLTPPPIIKEKKSTAAQLLAQQLVLPHVFFYVFGELHETSLLECSSKQESIPVGCVPPACRPYRFQ